MGQIKTFFFSSSLWKWFFEYRFFNAFHHGIFGSLNSWILIVFSFSITYTTQTRELFIYWLLSTTIDVEFIFIIPNLEYIFVENFINFDFIAFYSVCKRILFRDLTEFEQQKKFENVKFYDTFHRSRYWMFTKVMDFQIFYIKSYSFKLFSNIIIIFNVN